MTERADIEQFIAATFKSVWALELLGELQRHAGEPLSHEQMVERLRGSNMVISNSLATLSAAGLVMIDEQNNASYQPTDAKLDLIVSRSLDYYRTSPDAVRRIITAAWNPGIHAFAHAFKIRKESD